MPVEKKLKKRRGQRDSCRMYLIERKTVGGVLLFATARMRMAMCNCGGY
jgi:hypothetical protein